MASTQRADVSTDYQPGACNIGRAEQRVRYGVGAIGFVASAAVVAAAVVLSWPRWVLLATALPLFAGFVGYYQGREKFCVRYAYEGVYNVSDRLGERDTVPDDRTAEADRRHARSLVARAGVAAVAVAVVAYLAIPG